MNHPTLSSEQDSAVGYNIAEFFASCTAKKILDSDSKKLQQEGGERDTVPRQPRLQCGVERAALLGPFAAPGASSPACQLGKSPCLFVSQPGERVSGLG